MNHPLYTRLDLNRYLAALPKVQPMNRYIQRELAHSSPIIIVTGLAGAIRIHMDVYIYSFLEFKYVSSNVLCSFSFLAHSF